MAKEKKELIVGVNGDLSDNFTTGQKAILGLQNTLAMCGVILVPILCGLDVSVTLFCAGIGTIIYQFIDKKMVPAFLGGSFAIIAGVSTVVGEMGIPYAQGGILGMAVFHHKTRHWYFRWGLPAMFLLQAAGAVYLLAR